MIGSLIEEDLLIKRVSRVVIERGYYDHIHKFGSGAMFNNSVVTTQYVQLQGKCFLLCFMCSS